MIYLFIIISVLFPISLQEVYDNAEPIGEYDKYLILDSNTTYYGGIGLYEGNVMIEGNGAIIDLQNYAGIWVYGSEDYPCNLDIKYCSIVNGEYDGLNFSGTSTGNIENCNFIDNNIGLKLMDQVTVNVDNSNFINNSTYGLAIITEDPTCNINYSNSWNNGEYDFMENCPGWGSIWTPWEPEGINLIYQDPLFTDIENRDYSYSIDSPCIDSGNPNQTDPDGTTRDIGAVIYDTSLAGDCNNDNQQDVLDLIFNMNNCILELILVDCECSDLNQDTEYNVLDIVVLINLILEN